MKQGEEAEEPRRKVVVEAPRDGRGGHAEPTARALTLAEKLYRDEAIDVDEWQAAGALRNAYFLVQPPSTGVSSYGLGSGGADPARKADRVAKRLTGLEIQPNGEVTRGQSRSNRSDAWKLADMLFAVGGVWTQSGDKVVDPAVVRIVLRACTDSEHPPTQLSIGQARTTYASKKQLSGIGSNFLREKLRRLALHLEMAKGEKLK